MRRAPPRGGAAGRVRIHAREARAECARRVAGSDAQRARAENNAAAAREAEAAAVAEAASARREAERAAAVLEERGVQLQILTETIEVGRGMEWRLFAFVSFLCLPTSYLDVFILSQQTYSRRPTPHLPPPPSFVLLSHLPDCLPAMLSCAPTRPRTEGAAIRRGKR